MRFSPIVFIMPVAAIMLMGGSCSPSTDRTSSEAAPPAAKDATVIDFENDANDKTPDRFAATSSIPHFPYGNQKCAATYCLNNTYGRNWQNPTGECLHLA